METYQDNITTEKESRRFCVRRIMALARYYSPRIEKQLLIYLIISVCFAIITLLPLHELAQVGLFTIIWSACPLMFQLAPCAFAKYGSSRIIERLIPVSTAEKFAFRMLYFFVAVPAAVYILPYSATYLYAHIGSDESSGLCKLIRIMHENSLQIRLINILGGVGCTLTCLYTVSRARTSRILKGVIAVFGVQIGISILGAFWGMSTAFKAGMKAGIQGLPIDSERATMELTQAMLDSPYLYIVVGVLVVFVGLMLVLNYRLLKRQNL